MVGRYANNEWNHAVFEVKRQLGEVVSLEVNRIISAHQVLNHREILLFAGASELCETTGWDAEVEGHMVDMAQACTTRNTNQDVVVFACLDEGVNHGKYGSTAPVHDASTADTDDLAVGYECHFVVYLC
jgi:hypothetical protein